MDLLNVADPGHTLDVVSVIEATLENPRAVLIAQEKAERGRAIGEMKADGVEYDERMALLEDVTYPRPLAELLDPAFTMYVRTNPWVAGEELKPKAVVRDLLEKGDTFAEYISQYGLERSEGVVLRYLADAYRALKQVVPAEHRTAEVGEIVEWLGEFVRGVDSTMLDEWEAQLDSPMPNASAGFSTVTAGFDPTVIAGSDHTVFGGSDHTVIAGSDHTVIAGPDHTVIAGSDPQSFTQRGITANQASFRRLVRNAIFKLVELAAREDYDALANYPWVDDAANTSNEVRVDRWADALDPLFLEQGDDAIGIDAAARSSSLLTIIEPGQPVPSMITSYALLTSRQTLANPNPTVIAGTDPTVSAGTDPPASAGSDPTVIAGTDPTVFAGSDPTVIAGTDPQSQTNTRFLDDDGVLLPGFWLLHQVFDDADKHHDYTITALVDLAASDAAEAVVLQILQVGQRN
jgi:hypothetical protein